MTAPADKRKLSRREKNESRTQIYLGSPFLKGYVKSFAN